MDQLIIELLGTIVTVVVSITTLAYWLGRKFTEMDYRFREVNGRIDEVERRLNARIEEVNRGIITEVDKRMEEVNKRIDEVNKRIDETNNRISRLANSVASAMENVQAFVLEYMGVKGLLTRDEVDFAVHEVSRIIGTIRANPITKEELEFIKSVFSKSVDDMTMEELDKVIEIAKRWFVEEGSEASIKILNAAIMVRAYKRGEEYRRRRGSQTQPQQPH